MLTIFLILFVGVVFIIISTTRFNLHPFLALLITAYGVAIMAGIPLADISGIISGGFGSTLKSIGLVIIAGTIIGVILEKSNATITISQAIIRLVTEKRPTMALSIIGYIVSIPVFCDSAFVILSSLNKSLSQKTKTSIVPLAIALSTGLYAPHVLIPPTPGPLAAAANLEMSNLLLVIVMGLLIAVPVVIAGHIFANFLIKKYPFDPALFSPPVDIQQQETRKLPGLTASLAPIIVPIILMALGTTTSFLHDYLDFPRLINLIGFVGTPVNALLIGMGFAFLLMPGLNKETLNDWVGEGLKNAALIIMITGVGGALGAVLQQMPLQELLSEGLATRSMGIFLPFLIAAVLKTAQGSSTVAIITTSAILFPMLNSLGLDSDMGKALVVMATGAGAMTVSHANDSYFWVVSQFSGMDIKTAYRTQTMASLIQGVTGIVTVYLVSLIVV
jgi:GntP family gluconate:H+ symporter